MRKKYFIKFITLALLFSTLSQTMFFDVGAASDKYNVYVLTLNSKDKKIERSSSKLETTNYSTAYKKMNELKKDHKDVIITSNNSPSPLKIVAASRAFAQSYPYRKNIGDGSLTLKFYKNKNLTTRTSYISGHYPMYVHDFQHAGSKVIEVEYQGGRGYVDLYKTDIIPSIYIENNIPIQIGGTQKGDYYTEIEAPVNVVVKPDTYRSIKDSKYGNSLRISYSRSYPTLSGGTLTYALAPSYLQENKDYYSLDGIQFYEDIDFKKPVGEKFYAYYQWLPVRTLSNITSVDFNKLLKKYNYTDAKSSSNYSVMFNSENAFIEFGHHYGMNPLLIFAQASLESAYGSSGYAKDRYNLFGWNAVDSNPNNASSYEGVEKAVEKFMGTQLTGYFNYDDYRYYGNSFGNKGAGISVYYASDPHYGIKVANIAYSLDRDLGFKDYNAYDLFALEDGKTHSFKQDASPNSKTFYNTKHNQNQIINSLGEKNSYLKTNLGMSFYNDDITKSDRPTDLTKSFAYVLKNGKSVKKHGSAKGNIPKNIITVSSELQTTTVTAENGLNMRTGWSTENDVILTIPYGTKLNVRLTSNGWAKVAYKKYVGFVSADHLGDLSLPDPGTGEEPDEFLLGDVNGDGEITSLDYMLIKHHIMGVRKLSKSELKRADISKDGDVTSLDYMQIKKIIMER